MKTRVTIGVAAILLGGLLFGSAAPAGATTPPQPKPTIADIVARSGGTPDHNPWDYDLLLSAVKAAGLVETLATPSLDVTVWAPNDRAFVRLARDLGYQGGYDEGAALNTVVAFLGGLPGGLVPNLTAVLTYHVTPGARNVFDVIFTRTFPTLQGETITRRFLTLEDKAPNLRDPRLTLPLNVVASNGIIHTIDRVLIPTLPAPTA